MQISARTLTALLGGEIDLEVFRSLHRMPNNTGAPPLEPLQRVINEGRRLVSVNLEAMPGVDDDLIVLCFGPTDPAKVIFRILNNQT
jgi:hypothetical protein